MLEYWDAVSFHAYRQTNPETAIDEIRSVRQLIKTCVSLSYVVLLFSSLLFFYYIFFSFLLSK